MKIEINYSGPYYGAGTRLFSLDIEGEEEASGCLNIHAIITAATILAEKQEETVDIYVHDGVKLARIGRVTP